MTRTGTFDNDPITTIHRTGSTMRKYMFVNSRKCMSPQLRAQRMKFMKSLKHGAAAVVLRDLAMRVCDAVGDFDDMPWHIQDMFVSDHLYYKDRFKLTVFLLNNRCPPPLIAEFYLVRGVLCDHSAKLHVASIIKDHRDGRLEEKGVTSYVMGATEPNGDPSIGDRRYRTVCTPSFAYQFQHRHWWDEAIKDLAHDRVKYVPNELPTPTPPVSSHTAGPKP